MRRLRIAGLAVAMLVMGAPAEAAPSPAQLGGRNLISGIGRASTIVHVSKDAMIEHLGSADPAKVQSDGAYSGLIVEQMLGPDRLGNVLLFFRVHPPAGCTASGCYLREWVSPLSYNGTGVPDPYFPERMPLPAGDYRLTTIAEEGRLVTAELTIAALEGTRRLRVVEPSDEVALTPLEIESVFPGDPRSGTLPGYRGRAMLPGRQTGVTGLLAWDVSDVGVTGFEGVCLAPADSGYFDEEGYCARYTWTREARVLYAKRAGGLGEWCWTFLGCRGEYVRGAFRIERQAATIDIGGYLISLVLPEASYP